MFRFFVGLGLSSLLLPAQTSQSLVITAGSATTNQSGTSNASLPPPGGFLGPYGGRDDDGDGLPNAQELRFGSDPLLRNSDTDGLDDYEEAMRGSDPRKDDTDGDGIPDDADGWPRQPWLTMPPVPAPGGYVIVPLRDQGFPATAVVDYAYGGELNDRGDVLGRTAGYDKLVFFNGATHQSTEIDLSPSYYGYYGYYGYGYYGYYGYGYGYGYGNGYGYGYYYGRHRLGEGGHVIGQMIDNNRYTAGLWHEGQGAPTALSPGSQYSYSYAAAVNGQGEVVGQRQVYQGLGNSWEDEMGGVSWGTGNWLAGLSEVARYTSAPSLTHTGEAFWPWTINETGIVGGVHETINMTYDYGSGSWQGAPPVQAAAIRENGTLHELGMGTIVALTSGVPVVVQGVDPNGLAWCAVKEQNQWVRKPFPDIWWPGSLSFLTPANFSYYYTVRQNDRLEMLYGSGSVVRNGVLQSVSAPAGWSVNGLLDINNSGAILGTARRTVDSQGQAIPGNLQVAEPVLLFPASMIVDANRDGKINDRDLNATSAQAPFRFWVNDDDDLHPGGAIVRPDWSTGTVDGVSDLPDFFPLVLDINSLLNAFPPGGAVQYKLKQADSALNFAYTSLTRATAYSYKTSPYSYAGADTKPITAAGVPLDATFLNTLKNGSPGGGVLLVEVNKSSVAPLVLTVEKSGVQVAEVSLQLSVGPRVLLLLHGMNSNTETWDPLVDSLFATSAIRSVDIRDFDFSPVSVTPSLSEGGVRCYRLQFGSIESTATARTGLEGVRASNAVGGISGVNLPYLSTPALKCGDFLTFEELAQEIDDAIDLILDRHPGAQIVLVAHSRGGLVGRKFLEGSSSRRSAVIGFLITSSLQQGSPVGRIYEWLDTHQRGAIGTDSDDWDVVDFLRNPLALGISEKPTLDARRPVIGDMSDRSSAIANLNNPSQVANLPKKIIYGEIINSRVNLGVIALHEGLAPRYTIFDESGTGNLLDQVSSAAQEHILGVGRVPSDFPGDGLIPFTHQVFTQLPGFPAPGFPPAPAPATGQNTIPRLVVRNRDIVHTAAPLQAADISSQLKLIIPGWFP